MIHDYHHNDIQVVDDQRKMNLNLQSTFNNLKNLKLSLKLRVETAPLALELQVE
jgi:hypothetical protein